MGHAVEPPITLADLKIGAVFVEPTLPNEYGLQPVYQKIAAVKDASVTCTAMLGLHHPLALEANTPIVQLELPDAILRQFFTHYGTITGEAETYDPESTFDPEKNYPDPVDIEATSSRRGGKSVYFTAGIYLQLSHKLFVLTYEGRDLPLAFADDGTPHADALRKIRAAGAMMELGTWYDKRTKSIHLTERRGQSGFHVSVSQQRSPVSYNWLNELLDITLNADLTVPEFSQG